MLFRKNFNSGNFLSRPGNFVVICFVKSLIYFFCKVRISSNRLILVTDALLQISDAAEKHDYSRGLGVVQFIVQKANFSEVSSFLPGVKNLLTVASQLKV